MIRVSFFAPKSTNCVVARFPISGKEIPVATPFPQEFHAYSKDIFVGWISFISFKLRPAIRVIEENDPQFSEKHQALNGSF